MKKRTDLTGAFKLDPVYLKHSHQDSGKPLALLSAVVPIRAASMVPRSQGEGSRLQTGPRGPGAEPGRAAS